MSIYTKNGDKGETSLLTGTKVPKFHSRVEAYGTVDELNAYIGLLRSSEYIDSEAKKTLIYIQNQLFSIGSHLAMDKTNSNIKLPEISQENVHYLENEIDKMNTELPPLNSFILPGGNNIVSYAHVARTTCRRAERVITKLAYNAHVEELFIIYLNRLSDYLFVLARKLAKDTNAEEIAWQSQ